MTKEQRIEKDKLHKDLVNLLTDAPTDEIYYTRLIWANEIVANILSNWYEVYKMQERQNDEV